MDESKEEDTDDSDADDELAEVELSDPPEGDEISVDEQIKQLFEDDNYFLSQLTMVSITQFSEYCEEMQFLKFILWKANILGWLYLTVVSLYVEEQLLYGRILSILSASLI